MAKFGTTTGSWGTYYAMLLTPQQFSTSSGGIVNNTTCLEGWKRLQEASIYIRGFFTSHTSHTCENIFGNHRTLNLSTSQVLLRTSSSCWRAVKFFKKHNMYINTLLLQKWNGITNLTSAFSTRCVLWMARNCSLWRNHPEQAVSHRNEGMSLFWVETRSQLCLHPTQSRLASQTNLSKTNEWSNRSYFCLLFRLERSSEIWHVPRTPSAKSLLLNLFVLLGGAVIV